MNPYHKPAILRVDSAMNWIDINLQLPEPYREVLVWIDGHRGPMWRNNHGLVAYMTPDGRWLQERHKNAEPLIGVTAWAQITGPDDE